MRSISLFQRLDNPVLLAVYARQQQEVFHCVCPIIRRIAREYAANLEREIIRRAIALL